MAVEASGLSMILDGLGDKLAAAAANREQLQGLAAGGLLPAGTGPGPSMLQRLIGVGMDGTPYTPQNNTPAMPTIATTGGSVSPASSAAPSGDLMSMFQNAIKGNESGGRYDALGPRQVSGDRAFGAYQVMGANVGPWTKEVLGAEMTPEQFLANPQAQDAVFNAKFGQSLQKYGNPADAASVWFTGRPQSQGADRRDSLGTTGSAYVRKFMAALPGGGGQAPSLQTAAYAPQSGNAAGAALAPAIAAIGRLTGASNAVPKATADSDNPGGQAPSSELAFAGSAPSSSAPPASASGAGVTAPGATAAPGGAGAALGPGSRLNGMISLDQIKSMILNPATRQMGLGLWQQYLQPPQTTFGKPGEMAFVNGRPVYSIPNSPMKLTPGESLVSGTGTPLYQSPPNLKLEQIGEDAFGNKQFGTFNSQSGAVAPVGGGSAGGVSASPSGGISAAIAAGKTGEDFLSSLPVTMQGQVKAIAEGRAPAPTGQSLRTPIGQMLNAAVNAYDPTFESGNGTNRNAVRTDFSKGPTANAITAGNTAIQHLADIAETVGELGNLDTGIPGNDLVNGIKNRIGQSSGKATAVNKFNTAVGDFAGELTKFYRGAGGSEADLNRVFQDLNTSQSPSQLKAAIQQQMKLISGKINALQDRWHQGMGPSASDFPIISPTTQKSVDTINRMSPVENSENKTASSPIPAAAPQAGAGLAAQAAKAPQRVNSVSEAMALPSGTPFMTPDGRIKVRP